MSVLSNAIQRALSMALSPRAAKMISDGLDATLLVPTATKTANQNAQYGQLVVIDATAGALTVTAPDPTVEAGGRWGIKLLHTASGHTATAVAHGAETFDGGAAPNTSTAGGLLIFTSDGTNWIVTGKI